MMRTTVTLETDVEAGLRREMRRTGKGFKEALNETLRAGLAKRLELADVEPFRVEPRPLGVRPGLDYSNVGDLLEVAEGATHG